MATCGPEKYYDNRNTWVLIKTTIIVIFSVAFDQVLSIGARVSSQSKYKKLVGGRHKGSRCMIYSTHSVTKKTFG